MLTPQYGMSGTLESINTCIKYGHMLYDLDFVHPIPADDPAPVLDTLKLYLSGQGINPYTRQRESAERREQSVEAMQTTLEGLAVEMVQQISCLCPEICTPARRRTGRNWFGLSAHSTDVARTWKSLRTTKRNPRLPMISSG